MTIQSSDGLTLVGWWLTPHASNGSAAIVCHGVGDSAFGALGFAPLFLSHGYSVLVPDSRGHGESQGFVTYGVLEPHDIVRWLAWINTNGFMKVFGLGESLGGAILIESLARGASFAALVAECPYKSFEEIADERVGRRTPAPIAKLLVKEGILYVWLRYGVDLFEARPEDAIEYARVPVLLIHGEADHETSPENSTTLHRKNPGMTSLWLIPGRSIPVLMRRTL